MTSKNLLADDFVKNGPQQYMITGVSNLANQPAGDFSIDFSRPLDCSQGNWNVSLVDLNVWNTLYNITSRYGNTTYRWSVPQNADPSNLPPLADRIYTPIEFTGTLLPGSYNAPTLIADIINTITYYPYSTATPVAPVLSSTGAAQGIALTINTAQLTFDLTLGGQGFAFDPSNAQTGKLYRNLGARQNTIYRFPGTTDIPNGTNVNWQSAPFPNQADISNGITSWQVRCSLVGTSYQNGRATDVLYNFLPSVAPGGAYAVQPAFPLKHQLNVKNIMSVNFKITDQNGNVLNLQEGTDYANNGTTIACMVSRVGT